METGTKVYYLHYNIDEIPCMRITELAVGNYYETHHPHIRLLESYVSPKDGSIITHRYSLLDSNDLDKGYQIRLYYPASSKPSGVYYLDGYKNIAIQEYRKHFKKHIEDEIYRLTHSLYQKGEELCNFYRNLSIVANESFIIT